MRKEQRTCKMFLDDIPTAMGRIAENNEGYDFDQFKKDYKTIDAVIRNFEIIGEASKEMDDKIKGKYPNIPWKEMYYLRNRISHSENQQ